VIDHVVLGDVRYWSFKEAGRLWAPGCTCLRWLRRSAFWPRSP